MNFTADPEGELKLNSPITDEEKGMAGKFVDKLIRLEILILAQGEIRETALYSVWPNRTSQ
jgi:hypothetical protein